MSAILIVSSVLLSFAAGMAAQYLICYYNYKAKSKARFDEGWDTARQLYEPKPRRRNKLGQFAPKRKGGEK